MEQVKAKRVAIFIVSACLIGMVVGSAVTLAVLNVQRAIPSKKTVKNKKNEVKGSWFLLYCVLNREFCEVGAACKRATSSLTSVDTQSYFLAGGNVLCWVRG